MKWHLLFWHIYSSNLTNFAEISFDRLKYLIPFLFFLVISFLFSFFVENWKQTNAVLILFCPLQSSCFMKKGQVLNRSFYFWIFDENETLSAMLGRLLVCVSTSWKGHLRRRPNSFWYKWSIENGRRHTVGQNGFCKMFNLYICHSQ